MKSHRLILGVAAIIAALALCTPAFAVVADLSGAMTADNHYNVYISDDDSVAGTQFGFSYKNSGMTPVSFNDPDTTAPYDWATPESWGVGLTPGKTQYLHVEAADTGVIAGFLGQFSLAGGYRFDNGESTLLTGLDGWTVRSGSFNGTVMSLTALNKNGDGPWGSVSAIDSDARWIWTNNGNDIGSPASPAMRYFSAKINAVPEPISACLFLVGGGALAALRRRKA